MFSKNTERTNPVSTTYEIVSKASNENLSNGQTALINENIESIEKGFRRTQEFVNADGRSFSRTEEFTVTNKGYRRSVQQTNPSGSQTLLQETVELQENGQYIKEQRFTDASGETFLHLNENFKPDNAFILADGRVFQFTRSEDAHYRGTRVDMRV